MFELGHRYGKLSCLVALLISAWLPIACSRQQATSKSEVSGQELSRRYSQLPPEVKRYGEVFSTAMTTDDIRTIEKAITYIDGVIADGSAPSAHGVNISGAYYNKAELLVRLGRFDEALSTLRARKVPDDYYTATLLLRMGRRSEADAILKRLQKEYEELLSSDRIEKTKRVPYVQAMLMVESLLGENIKRIGLELVDNGVIKRSDLERIDLEELSNAKMLLEGAWPATLELAQTDSPSR